MSEAPDIKQLPSANLKPSRRGWIVWLVPVVALVLAGWLGFQYWMVRGVVVSVQLSSGQGLQPGDEVRHRGITVGKVQSVELTPALDGVVVTAALQSQPRQLARAGTRFWVVRPQLAVSGVAGLETIFGRRYLAVLPGDGPRQRDFVGLDEPPVVTSLDPGALEVLLESSDRSGLRRGAPVLYREVPVGVILSVGLTADGGAVEARALIHKPYIELVRPETRFWRVGGFNVDVGLRGVSMEMESLESLLVGGVSLATPQGAGDVVHTGHRFKLVAEPEKAWLQWQPMVALGDALLPPGAVMPQPMRAVIGWNKGRWLSSERSRQGWVLQVDGKLLGPKDLFTPDDASEREAASLDVAGRTLPLTVAPEDVGNGLAQLSAQVSDVRWPRSMIRSAETPEDCIVVADPAAIPTPLAASRLTVHEGYWEIDPVVPLDKSQHGGCVLSRADGKLIGMLLMGSDGARVALLPKM